ncbi:hypothetical protein GK047_28120 [Paenibacillus sp. SYP-B3998]|uniref:Uncharacterized protein n=1 Tax=Paenibacillus sp. SYP-B3998 TaxID=2678564 RepID=A0A6G4A643_9BACL|nr:hypothetical protein [Paenibacillus sp. SYP-B3998]NEW09790.1 hypothetical protein [Paenibacillus sp. SYP-B3998]
MDYFILKQDERYTNTPHLLNVKEHIDSRQLNLLNAHHIASTVVLQVEADAESRFLDILDGQLFLLSENMQKVVELYEPETLFKRISLIDLKQQRQVNYVLPIFREIDALSLSSEWNTNRSVLKKSILQADKIKGNKIFRIKESEKPLIVVRLDVAESMIRRNLAGIRLVRIPVE